MPRTAVDARITIMYLRRPSITECAVAGLIIFGLVAAIINWKHALGVVAIGCFLVVAALTLVALPSFFVFLFIEWSFAKAARRTRVVAARCLEFVGDLVAQF